MDHCCLEITWIRPHQVSTTRAESPRNPAAAIRPVYTRDGQSARTISFRDDGYFGPAGKWVPSLYVDCITGVIMDRRPCGSNDCAASQAYFDNPNPRAEICPSLDNARIGPYAERIRGNHLHMVLGELLLARIFHAAV